MKWLMNFLAIVITGNVQAQGITSPIQETTIIPETTLQAEAPAVDGKPLYIPEGMTPESHFWWLSCYSKNGKCCIDNRCTKTVSYEEFVRKAVLPEYRKKTRIVKVEDWNYRKIIWIVRGQ